MPVAPAPAIDRARSGARGAMRYRDRYNEAMRAPVAAIVLSGLILAACGTEQTDDSAGIGDGPPGDFVACDLLTAGEAEQWLGDSVGPPSKSDGPQATAEETCVYRSDVSGTSVLLQARFGAKYHSGIDSPANEQPVAISDLGDDAYSDRGRVAFLAGEWAVSISRVSGDAPDTALEEMARTVATRLP